MVHFFFLGGGFTAVSRIFYLYQADRSSMEGENRKTTFDLSEARTTAVRNLMD